jgi:5-carboxymethyl-2-hydroxymuconate isomerase
MPHIVIESTPRLFVAIDFVALFSAVHHRLAADGHAVLDDFKSRVHVTDRYLAGDDPDAEFVVARLVTTNPRPKTTQRAMAALIHDALRAAIEAEPRSYWWQCCVLIEPFDKADYLKTDSHGSSSCCSSRITPSA